MSAAAKGRRPRSLPVHPRSREWAGSIAIARVHGKRRQHVHAYGECPFGQRGTRPAALDLFEHIGELIAQEDRHDGRRRLVRAQPMIVARRRYGRPQQTLVRRRVARLPSNALNKLLTNGEFDIGTGRIRKRVST